MCSRKNVKQYQKRRKVPKQKRKKYRKNRKSVKMTKNEMCPPSPVTN